MEGVLSWRFHCILQYLTKVEEKKTWCFPSWCLRGIYRIRWQQHVSNTTVLETARMEKISCEIRRRRWNWIGHILRKDRKDDCMIALGWAPDGKRKRGRPKTTWRRMTETERNTAGWKTWNEARLSANNRQQWRNDVADLCDFWRGET